jgi:hypothetical protein
MFPLLLITFLPAIRRYLLGQSVQKNDIIAISKKLYHQIPGVSHIVDEKGFVEFCLKHQEKIFPAKTKAPVKAVAKKTVAKKKSAKKVAKKAPAKKVAAKKK